MPAGDRTGPAGMGPMTGRAVGLCAGSPAPGFASSARPGRTGGRGHRHQYFATGLPVWARAGQSPLGGFSEGANKEQEATALRSEAERLGAALGSINRRLADLETDSKPGSTG